MGSKDEKSAQVLAGKRRFRVLRLQDQCGDANETMWPDCHQCGIGVGLSSAQTCDVLRRTWNGGSENIDGSDNGASTSSALVYPN